jgi:phosphoesterase RecJ-like protein
MIPKIDEIKQAIDSAQKIVVIQADNPDGDSLGSALALEHILGDLGKDVWLYCGVDIPGYLKYLSGWDRVMQNIPSQFDLTIIVDTSANSLLEKLNGSDERNWVAAKPVIVLDHHKGVECDIPYASIVANSSDFVSTGELIYQMSKDLQWAVSVDAGECLLQSILSDTLGLTSDAPGGDTYRRIAELLDMGVSRGKLESQRRELSKMHPKVFAYKAELIKRTEFYNDGRTAVVVIPESELYDISPLYNPGALFLSEVLMVEGVDVGISFKVYKNRVTGAIRCSDNAHIAGKVAESFGGGGHPFAAGFKIEAGNIVFDEIKGDVLAKVTELLG